MKRSVRSLLLFFLFGSLTLSALPALAQSVDGSAIKNQTNPLNPDEVDPKRNTIPNPPDIDDLIKNNSLRAYSGSKSRWSLASTWNYNGGAISSPFSQDRPNIADQSATTTKSDLDGNISAKYNINLKNSVMAGVGVRWIAPLSRRRIERLRRHEIRCRKSVPAIPVLVQLGRRICLASPSHAMDAIGLDGNGLQHPIQY